MNLVFQSNFGLLGEQSNKKNCFLSFPERARDPPTVSVHWQGYRGQFHILHWTLLFFCSSGEIKVRIRYFKVVSIHFMSNVWLKAHFSQTSFVIWWKICIFDTKNLIPRYSATFQLPSYLNLQKMNKIQLFSYGEIQANQI